MPPSGTSKSSLRSQLRAIRHQLTAGEQDIAANKLAYLVNRQAFFKRSHKIAYYWANDGELSLHPLYLRAEQHNKHGYLPILKPGVDNSLLFLPFSRESALRNNRYGIPEPDIGVDNAAPLWTLDVVFLPLVGFDRWGNRLGMGAGYYDRTFARLHLRPQKPLLIGIGYSCQQVERLPTEPWDIPVDAIITENRVWCSPANTGRLFQRGDCEYFLS